MKKIGITVGVAAAAILAIAYVFTSGSPQEAQLTFEPEAVAITEAAASPAPTSAQDVEVMLEPAVTEAPYAKQPAKTRGLGMLVTQDRTGTECKTPSGRVCTVSPGRINSPCACGSQNGLIIR